MALIKKNAVRSDGSRPVYETDAKGKRIARVDSNRFGCVRVDAQCYADAERLMQTFGKEDGLRWDAGETAMFARQLQYVKTATYDVRYPNLKARQFIPVDGSIPSGAESFVWRAWDWSGIAKIIANYSDDLPMVEALGGEVVQPLKSLGDKYSYSIQDVRAAAFGNSQLEVKRAQAARRAIENMIDYLGALGNSAANLPGMLNNTNVPVLSAGTDFTGSWGSATPIQIYNDMMTIANKVVTQTKGVHAPNTMLLPITTYQIVATTILNSVTSETVLSAFLKNSPYIRSVDQWTYLETAGGGSTTRAVAYERSPEVLELVISQEFEQFPPQPRNLMFDVPCHARVGGVRISYPMAMVYADGVS